MYKGLVAKYICSKVPVIAGYPGHVGMENTLPPLMRPGRKAILLNVTNVQLIIYKQVTV